MRRAVLLIFVLVSPLWGLENGLARTPPMGWLAWTRFMCETNCDRKPHNCISEKLFTEMAEIMVNEGYLKAGYNRVNIDDCWAERKRGSDHKITPDGKRFSHGIKWLAKFMHDRGLLLGIYANYGRKTCMGFPGTEIHDMPIDAQTFADWDVDMVKFDGCFNDPNTLDNAYPKMGEQLKNTKRKMVYSCSWPYYIRTEAKREPDYSQIMASCNLWRNFNDIQIHWLSVLSIIDFYDANQDELGEFHGPGHWNDPDMLIVGNPGLTLDQATVQMALWCVWSAPLLMSNDLRQMMPGTKELLLNSELIAINQDPMGVMGRRISQVGSISVYTKPIVPYLSDINGRKKYSYAIVFFNRNSKNPAQHDFSLDELGLDWKSGYNIRDVLNSQNLGVKASGGVLKIWVRPTAVVVLLAKINPGSDGKTDSQKKPIDEPSKTKDELAVNIFPSNSVMALVIILFILFVLWTRFRRYRLIIVILAILSLFLWLLFM